MPLKLAIVLTLERRPFGLVPVNDNDRDILASFPIGCRLRAELRRGKSADMLAFYWAVIDDVAAAVGYAKSALSQELLIRCGMVDSLKFRDGSVHAVPQSISAMTHHEFKEFVDRALDLICADYVAEMTPGALRVQVEQRLGIDGRAEHASQDRLPRQAAADRTYH